MNILIASSEGVPYSKTGGLADVCGALPIALDHLGQKVAVILPLHRQTHFCGQPIKPLGIDFIVPIGSKMVAGRLWQGQLPGTQIPAYLVQQDEYFDRDELYRLDGKDYVDNCERFVFFSRAVLEVIRLLELDIDVIHANDWQTGLVPAYLKLHYRNLPRYQQIATVFTIHNMSYQGQFWHWDMLLTGLDWKYFNWHQMEFYGKLNLLKTGLVFADSITTVSPRYAQEIQNAPLGAGLEGVLQNRADVLRGILNGMDANEWNPEADPHLPAAYSPAEVNPGKAVCKAKLQEQLGLPVAADVPVVGFIGRLVDQKGVGLMAEVMQQWVQTTDVQWVVLGTGEAKYHRLFERLVERFPQKVAIRLDFSNPLAHLIEAGSDIFLMPSQFEPCGLNQLYSLKYGTVPVVRATGGLADTITDSNEATLAAGTANGFSFQEHSSLALGETLRRACEAYRQPELWSRIQVTGMRQDWSWSRSAKQYVQLYEETRARTRHAVDA